MKGLMAIVMVAYMVVATVGLAGGGPDWLRYVGAGTVMLMLLMIMQQVSNTPTTSEMRRMLGLAEQQKMANRDDIDELDAPEARTPKLGRIHRN